MLFRLVFSNHLYVDHIEDHLTLLRLVIEAAGHQVEYDDVLHVTGCCNVVIENLDMPQAASLRAFAEQGGDIILVATEYITGGTFNNFPGGHTLLGKDYWL